jgi:hypothetical protein
MQAAGIETKPDVRKLLKQARLSLEYLLQYHGLPICEASVDAIIGVIKRIKEAESE